MNTKQIDIIQAETHNLHLWKFAFQGLNELVIGGFALTFSLLIQFWEEPLVNACWPWLSLAILGLGISCLILMLIRGKALCPFEGYYRKRTGFMIPKAFPHSKWSTRSIVLASVVLGGVTSWFLVGILSSLNVSEHLIHEIFSWLMWCAMPLNFVISGSQESYMPRLAAGILMYVGVFIGLSVESFSLCLYSVGIGFLTAGFFDHRLFIHLWKTGTRIDAENAYEDGI